MVILNSDGPQYNVNYIYTNSYESDHFFISLPIIGIINHFNVCLFNKYK